MDCEDLYRELRAEFDKILKEAPASGDIMGEMVFKAKFNALVERAAKECKRYYSIKRTDHGYALSFT